MKVRHDWSADEVFALLTGPLDDLLRRAADTHREYAATDVQQCMLLSVKTGACPEDCGYCSQSAHFKTGLTSEPLMDVERVIEAARSAKAQGATRFCLGAAWRQVPRTDDPRFTALKKMVSGVAELGVEVCCTLGMATEAQLHELREAGLTAYNHNLDTSRDYYPQIISTRTYDDRIETIRAARRANVQVCCGGIVGLGETVRDRAALLSELANFDPHPESVPINLLHPIDGTPLAGTKPVPFEEFLRMIAAARILMPQSRVRLSAGRNRLTEAEQMLCFQVGANSIFIGEKLLTAPNVAPEADRRLTERLATEAAP